MRKLEAARSDLERIKLLLLVAISCRQTGHVVSPEARRHIEFRAKPRKTLNRQEGW